MTSLPPFNPGTVFYGYADEIVLLEIDDDDSSNHLKQEKWQQMGDYLETNNYPKHMISKKIQDTIEAKLEQMLGHQASITTAHYYRVMLKNKWTNPSFRRNITKDSDSETDPPEGSKNSSLKTKFKHKNKPLIKRLDAFCEQVLRLRSYAKENSFLDLIEDKSVKDDIFTRLDAFTKNFSDYMNNKQAVPENAQLIFLLLNNAALDINNLFGLFFEEVKRINLQNRIKAKKSNHILTSKEMGKFTSRDLVTLSKYLEFGSANEARLSGFYGQRCIYCNGFRTKIMSNNSNHVYCVRCSGKEGKESFPRHQFFTCTRCKYFLDRNMLEADGGRSHKKCPNCSLKIILPKEIN